MTVNNENWYGYYLRFSERHTTPEQSLKPKEVIDLFSYLVREKAICEIIPECQRVKDILVGQGYIDHNGRVLKYPTENERHKVEEDPALNEGWDWV